MSLEEVWQEREERPASLEEALQAHEKQVDDLLKAANKYVRALKKWQKACQMGHIGDIQKAMAQAVELAPTLTAPTKEAASSWSFDVSSYLASADWRKELQTTAAEKYGLRVLEEGEILISSPVVVRSQPGRNGLLIGKTTCPTIRPLVVAAQLKRLRERIASANSQEFLECLFAKWQRLTKAGHPVAKFRDIYVQFCETPGYKKDTPEAAFGLAIYTLHRSEIRATRKGRTFEIIYPSGNFKERDVFTVIAEDGRPIRYYGIRFR